MSCTLYKYANREHSVKILRILSVRVSTDENMKSGGAVSCS